MPAWDEWKEEKIASMLNGTVFYTYGPNLLSVTGIKIFGVNIPTCKFSARLKLNGTIFQYEIIAINAVVSELMERNYNH